MEPLTDAQLAAFWPMVTPEAIYNTMPRELKERLVRQVILRWAFESQEAEELAQLTDFTDEEDEDIENRPFYI